MNSQAFGNMLQNHLMPFMNREFRGAQYCIPQDDNAPPHRAKAIQQLTQQLHVQTLSWLSRSPDLNPVEHVWSFKKRRIDRRYPLENAQQFRQAMTDA